MKYLRRGRGLDRYMSAEVLKVTPVTLLILLPLSAYVITQEWAHVFKRVNKRQNGPIAPALLYFTSFNILCPFY